MTDQQVEEAFDEWQNTPLWRRIVQDMSTRCDTLGHGPDSHKTQPFGQCMEIAFKAGAEWAERSRL